MASLVQHGRQDKGVLSALATARLLSFSAPTDLHARKAETLEVGLSGTMTVQQKISERGTPWHQASFYSDAFLTSKRENFGQPPCQPQVPNVTVTPYPNLSSGGFSSFLAEHSSRHLLQ